MPCVSQVEDQANDLGFLGINLKDGVFVTLHGPVPELRRTACVPTRFGGLLSATIGAVNHIASLDACSDGKKGQDGLAEYGRGINEGFGRRNEADSGFVQLPHEVEDHPD